MSMLPGIKIIINETELIDYQNQYFENSGLEVPMSYLHDNKVFGFFYAGKLIGGFVLGTDKDFRTIRFFAKEESRPLIKAQIENPDLFTELCCFWIAPGYRCKTKINLFLWFLMSIALKRHSKPYLLFGTCSKGLARLYGSTKHSILIHKDRVNKNSTFIFIARKSICIQGISEIILKKIRRILMMKFNWSIPREYNLELRLVPGEKVISYFTEKNKWRRIRI